MGASTNLNALQAAIIVTKTQDRVFSPSTNPVIIRDGFLSNWKIPNLS